jgi:hypothetical protein
MAGYAVHSRACDSTVFASLAAAAASFLVYDLECCIVMRRLHYHPVFLACFHELMIITQRTTLAAHHTL